MQLQRRLSGLERDLAAIQAKLDSLNQEADRIQDAKPEEAAAIREKITQITELWQELKTMVCNKHPKFIFSRLNARKPKLYQSSLTVFVP